MEMVPKKWEDMNMDCLVNILGRLDTKMLSQDVPLVCKSWYKATRIPQCWTRLDFSAFKFKDDRPRQRRRRGRNYRPKISSSSITNCVKFAVRRSNGSATYLRLPNECSKEALLYTGSNCPNVTTVLLPIGMPREHLHAIPPLIANWKNLEVLILSTKEGNIKEIVTQIGTHCENFVSLGAPGVTIYDADADAIATFLPKLKRLGLKKSLITKKGMVSILKGCKELNFFMARDCIGFQEDDAEIMLLAAHIPTFIPAGSYKLSSLDDMLKHFLMD